MLPVSHIFPTRHSTKTDICRGASSQLWSVQSVVIIRDVYLKDTPSRMTIERGVASLRILQLGHNSVNKRTINYANGAYHSSSSTLKVLAFENMLSYAPMRVKIASTGHSLGMDQQGSRVSKRHGQYRARLAGTNMPSCAMICEK